MKDYFKGTKQITKKKKNEVIVNPECLYIHAFPSLAVEMVTLLILFCILYACAVCINELFGLLFIQQFEFGMTRTK